MSKRKKARRDAGPRSQRAPTARASMRVCWIALAAIAVVAIATYVGYDANQRVRSIPSAEVAASPVGHYVGGKTCAPCHAREYDGWKGSHHDLAMQHANEQSVLGDFGNAKFRYASITSTFFKRDGTFLVNTDCVAISCARRWRWSG